MLQMVDQHPLLSAFITLELEHTPPFVDQLQPPFQHFIAHWNLKTRVFLLLNRRGKIVTFSYFPRSYSMAAAADAAFSLQRHSVANNEIPTFANFDGVSAHWFRV